MGFATNRVVSKGMNKTGLSAVQLKGMSKLQNICGVKKPEEKKENNDNTAIIEKLSNKKEDCTKNKLTADFEDVKSNQEVKTLGRIDNDNSSLLSVATSESVSTSETFGSSRGNSIGKGETSIYAINEINEITPTNAITSKNEVTKKPANKKGFSLKNLI